MPVDTSIYQMLGHGVTPIKTPQELDLQNQQMRQMKAQTGLLETQQLGAQQQQADADLLKKTAAEVSAKAQAAGRPAVPAEYAVAFRATGTPAGVKAAHEAEQAIAATDKAQREAQLAQLTIDKQHIEEASRVTAGLMALPPEQRAAAWPEALKAFAAIDPNKAKAAAEKYPTYPGDEVVGQMHQFTQSETVRLQQAQAAQVKAHQDAQLAETARHNKESERIAEIAAKKPNAAITIAMNDKEMEGYDPSKPLGDPSAEAQAHLWGSWERKAPEITTRTPIAQKKAVARANYLAQNQYGHETGLPGDADVADVVAGRKEYGPAGATGRQITASATAVRHLNFLEQLGNALDNNDVTAANQVKQAIAKATGKAAPTNYAGASALVVPEVLRAAKGAGVIGEEEEKRLLAANSNISSPAQMRGFINTMAHLMGDRLTSMQPNYAKYNRNGSIAERIDPDARNLMAKYGINLPPVGGKVNSNAPKIAPALGNKPPTITDATGKVGYLYSDGNYYSQKPAGQ